MIEKNDAFEEQSAVAEFLAERKADAVAQTEDTSADFIYDKPTGYFDDAVWQFADNSVDFYTSDLLEWALTNYTYIDDATAEFGRANDFLGEIMQGQAYKAREELIHDKGLIMQALFADFLLDNEDAAELLGLERLQELFADFKFDWVENLDDINWEIVNYDYTDKLSDEALEQLEQLLDTVKVGGAK